MAIPHDWNAFLDRLMENREVIEQEPGSLRVGGIRDPVLSDENGFSRESPFHFFQHLIQARGVDSPTHIAGFGTLARGNDRIVLAGAKSESQQFPLKVKVA